MYVTILKHVCNILFICQKRDEGEVKKQTRSTGYESEENRGQSWLGKALVQSNKDVLLLVYMIKSVETISFYFPSL